MYLATHVFIQHVSQGIHSLIAFIMTMHLVLRIFLTMINYNNLKCELPILREASYITLSTNVQYILQRSATHHGWVTKIRLYSR